MNQAELPTSRIKSVELITDEILEQAQASGNPPSVHVTCYAYGGMASAVLNSWIDLASYFSRNKRLATLRTIREDALISRSRSRATAFFLDDKLKADVWIQLDHDIQFSVDDLMAIADLSHKHQACVCIPYSCRSLPPRPALRAKADAVPLIEEPSLTPITMFASGAVAIPRQALVDALDLLSKEDVPHPYRIEWCDDELTSKHGAGKFPTLWLPFVMDVQGKGKDYLSEDYAASARLAITGIPQYAYTPKTPLQHWGEFNYRL